jgi:hypothetical protein
MNIAIILNSLSLFLKNVLREVGYETMNNRGSHIRKEDIFDLLSFF